MFKQLIIIVFFLAVSGCSTTKYEKQNSAFIMFKTPSFKYADMGFIYRNNKQTKIEMYASGQSVVSFTLSKNNICTTFLSCLSNRNFNQKVLSGEYEDDILSRIFDGKKLFAGINSVKTRNGFTQKIKKVGRYDIIYKILDNQIIFSDTINKIYIKIKKFKG